MPAFGRSRSNRVGMNGERRGSATPPPSLGMRCGWHQQIRPSPLGYWSCLLLVDVRFDAYLGLAMLHAWILEYQHMMLCVWWWIHTKAESQWPAGEDHRAALATSGSTRSSRMPTPHRYLLCRDLRSSGVTEWRNGPLGLYATTMMMMMNVRCGDPPE